MTASADEVARILADALEGAGIHYALGGAVALAYYGVPRATNDVDLGVYPGELAGPALVAALLRAGCTFNEQAALDALSQGNDFGVRCRGMRVDVFPPSHDLHFAIGERAVRQPLGGRPAWVVTAEDLVLLKLLWNRGQDIEDLKRLFAVWGERLDLSYVREWLGRIFAESDPRVAEFERLLREYLPEET